MCIRDRFIVAGPEDSQFVPKKRFETGIWIYTGTVTVEVNAQPGLELNYALERYNQFSGSWESVASASAESLLEHRATSGFHRLVVSKTDGTGSWTMSLNARRIAN